MIHTHKMIITPACFAFLIAAQLTGACRGPEDDSPDVVVRNTPAPSASPSKNDNSLEQGNQEPAQTPETLPQTPLTWDITDKKQAELDESAIEKIRRAMISPDTETPLSKGFHETSLPGPRFISLESAATKAETLLNPEILGIQVTDDEIIINLRKDYLFSFSKYSDGKKIKIFCNGFQLKLVGANFDNVSVDGRTVQGRKTRIILVSTGLSQPKIDLRGEDGKPGEPAVCPAGFELCLTDSPPQFPQATSEIESYAESKENMEPLATTGTPDSGINFTGLFQEGTPPPIIDKPAHDWSEIKMEAKIVSIEGNVKSVVSWIGRRFAQGRPASGRDGWSSRGQKGYDGSGGGELFEYFTDNNMVFSDVLLAGGKGGAAGLSGLILAGKGSASISFTEAKIEKKYLNNASFNWQVSALYLNPNGPILHGGGHQPIFEHRTRIVPGQFNMSEYENPNREIIEFHFEAGPDGVEATRETAKPGLNGEDGIATLKKVTNVDDFLRLTSGDVPLPQQMAELLIERVKAGELQ